MADSLDALLAQQAVGASSADPLDSLLANQASGKSVPTPNSAAPVQLSAFDRFAKGVNDVNAAGAQWLVHSLPSGVVDSVNSATKYVNDLPVVGQITKALGMTPATAQELDAQIKDKERQYQSARAAVGDKGVDWWRLGGNAITTAPLAAAFPMASGWGGGMALGALFGGISQPAADGDFAKEKLKQMALGSVTGGATGAAVNGVSRALNPAIRPEVQTLLDAGITPTPGQILGGGFKRAEEAMTSVPVLGDMVRNAQRRSMQDLNNAAINRSLTPIGESLPNGVIGREAIEFAQQKLSNAYDRTLNKIGAVRPDAQFGNDLANLSSLTKNLPTDTSAQFQRIINNEIVDRIRNGAITSDGLKAAESNLGQVARGYLRSADYDQRMLGSAIQEAQSMLRGLVARESPQNATELQQINAAYANFLRPQRAAAALGNENGIFTPAQLQGAVKSLDTSRNKGAFARGDALMQDLAEAGKNVLGNSLPDSGTPFRHAVQLGIGGLLGHSLMPAGMEAALLPAAGVGGAALLPYTQAGQKVVAGLLTNRPGWVQPVSKQIGLLAPYFGAASAPIAQSLLH